MPTPFDKFGFVDATQTVSRANAIANLSGLILSPFSTRGVADSTAQPVSAFGINTTALIRAMLDGDMWLGGAGWIGPRPQVTEDGSSETMRILQHGFISENVLGEVTDRHVNGVLGREPQWGLTLRRSMKTGEQPTDEESGEIGEAEALLTEWWDARKVHKFLMTATRTLLYARRSVIRLYVPSGKLSAENVADDTGRTKTVKMIRASDVPSGLAFVWPDAPLPESSAVAEDPDTKQSIGVVLYRRGQNVQGTGADQQSAELTYLAEPNAGGPSHTIIRQSGTQRQDVTVTLDFGGRISMYEMTREPFITTQMVQLQRSLNLALSALPRNVITAGWLERVISNAQMPGKWVNDAKASNGKRWVADKHVTGGGVTTYLRGLKQLDDSTGAVNYATPSVNWREPSPVHPTVDAAEAAYRTLLREAKQEHVLMSQDVKASGKSREQARSDFEMTLRTTVAEVNALGRWLIETSLAMAEAFAGQPGKFTTKYRATFECQIDTGPITADERVAIDASVQAGTLSAETAMGLEGVADPAAELARIAAQPGGMLDVIKKQADAILVLYQAGCDIEGAALLVGIDPAVAKKLVPQFSNGTGNPADAPGTNVDPNATPETEPKAAPTSGAKPGSSTGASSSGNSAGALPGDQQVG